MALTDFMQKLNNSYQPQTAPKPAPTLLSGLQNKAISKPTMTMNSPVGKLLGQNQAPANGPIMQSVLTNTKNNAADVYSNYRSQNNTELATDILKKSAGNVPTDKYGIVQKPPTNYVATATTNLGTINDTGKKALQGAEQAAQWQKLNQLQNSNGGSYDPNLLPAGATGDNPGAKAVAFAMTAYKNKTPYVWGGNSLSSGVDCSGLVQQAYAKLGIKLPRTTYEQAKSGQIIHGQGAALPGDLVFYNTGSSDPNGIGTNSHVAIYIGNGQVLEAANSRSGIRISNIGYSGTPGLIVRPWS